MATIEIGKDNFKDTVSKEGIVLLDWWAAWCAPCRSFAPIFEQASEKHSDIIFGKIDTDKEPELASAFAIRSIPTLMVFRDGIMLFEQAGALPAEALEDLIRQVRALDMNEIRQRLVERQAQQQQQPEAESPKT
ncbi:thioredoxin [Vitiosangium sp. GDMCC 1.1324]|uniref:thioredoxin n=1 Tax=Vitiosangium sp. (strain GDMCC 1.1324) TaxID=2138576 RepID=UPI000D363FD0|nr:thioredoxin [Vitiosangium sp. GDMCC 1.1324]PTL85116.1 thioredoxin [Vitiosangium sp. GDMCC 1.1324]